MVIKLPDTHGRRFLLGFCCASCRSPIRAYAGTVIEQGKIWCRVECYRAAGGRAEPGS